MLIGVGFQVFRELGSGGVELRFYSRFTVVEVLMFRVTDLVHIHSETHIR